MLGFRPYDRTILCRVWRLLAMLDQCAAFKQQVRLSVLDFASAEIDKSISYCEEKIAEVVEDGPFAPHPYDLPDPSLTWTPEREREWAERRWRAQLTGSRRGAPPCS